MVQRTTPITIRRVKKVFQSVKDITKTISEYGNPFLEDFGELVPLDTNFVSDKDASPQALGSDGELYKFDIVTVTGFHDSWNPVIL